MSDALKLRYGLAGIFCHFEASRWVETNERVRESKNPSYCNPSEFRTKANFTSDYAFPKKAQPTSSKSGRSGYCSRGQVEYFDDSGTTIANALPSFRAATN
jgi:hypothetical protein